MSFVRRTLLRHSSKNAKTKQYTIEQFLETVRYGGSSFSPDNTKLLVSSDKSGVSNAYALPVKGGEAVQLTDSEDSVSVISYFPNDERFLYTADQGGNELNHVYVRNLDGSIKDLTPGDKLKASFGGWDTRRQAILYRYQRARSQVL